MKKLMMFMFGVLLTVSSLVTNVSAGPILNIDIVTNTIDEFTTVVSIAGITGSDFHPITLPLAPFWQARLFIDEFNDLSYNPLDTDDTTDVVKVSLSAVHISAPHAGDGPAGEFYQPNLIVQATSQHLGRVIDTDGPVDVRHFGTAGHKDRFASAIDAHVSVTGDDFNIIGYNVILSGGHIPEPATLYFVAGGLAGLLLFRKRKIFQTN